MYWSDLKVKIAGDILITVWDNEKYLGIALVPHMFCQGSIKKAFIDVIKYKHTSVKHANTRIYINEIMKRHFPDIYGSFCVDHSDDRLHISVMPETEYFNINFERTKVKFTKDNIHVSYNDGEYEFYFTNEWVIKKSKKYDSMLKQWIFTGKYPTRECKVPHNVLSGLNRRLKAYTGVDHNLFGADKNNNIIFHECVTIDKEGN